MRLCGWVGDLTWHLVLSLTWLLVHGLAWLLVHGLAWLLVHWLAWLLVHRLAWLRVCAQGLSWNWLSNNWSCLWIVSRLHNSGLVVAGSHCHAKLCLPLSTLSPSNHRDAAEEEEEEREGPPEPGEVCVVIAVPAPVIVVAAIARTVVREVADSIVAKIVVATVGVPLVGAAEGVVCRLAAIDDGTVEHDVGGVVDTLLNAFNGRIHSI